ncbi:MAG: hypothetical protein ACRDQU_03835 [Pseudonocardiaceae bacterium]
MLRVEVLNGRLNRRVTLTAAGLPGGVENVGGIRLFGFIGGAYAKTGC